MNRLHLHTFSILLFIISVFSASVAAGANFVGRDIVVPFARTPGVFGSQWRTDLVVSNVSHLTCPQDMYQWKC
ncbi:MAG: hypothetical protein AB1898_28205 [Acidobacteriota bacterium]